MASLPESHIRAVRRPIDQLIVSELAQEVTSQTDPTVNARGPRARRSPQKAPAYLIGAALAIIGATITVLAVQHWQGERPALVEPPSARAPSEGTPAPAAAKRAAPNQPTSDLAKRPEAGGDASGPALRSTRDATRQRRTKLAHKRVPKSKPSPSALPNVPGYLTLHTEPWATAYLAGKKIGTTPFAKVALPPGDHFVTLDLEDKGKKKRVRVHIDSGSITRKRLSWD